MKKRHIMITLLAAALTLQSIPAFAAPAPDGKTDAATTPAAADGAWSSWITKWDAMKNDWTFVSMTPGKNETEMNFAWYSKTTDSTPVFQYGKTSDLSDAVTASVSQTSAQDGFFANRTTLTNLEAGTTYYYQVSGKEISSFTTDDDTSDFSFIFVGDPQIGSSNEEKAKKPEDIQKPSFLSAQSDSVRSDSFNWNHTLNLAYQKSQQKASFVLSAGDQIQTNAKKVKDNTISEIEYTGYLSPEILKSLPVATTVGNHDSDNANYTYHFNIPNQSELGSNGIVGGDYSYTYGDALFIMLNTQDTNIGEHKQFIEQTVKENPDCKWRIVTLHQDIYGSAEHSNEPEITNLRYELTPIFEENDIDVVLTGHDHAYSRSKMLVGGVKTNDYTDDAFDAQLEKDLDAGENPEQLTTAPSNIKDDTTDAEEQAYLAYLNSIMDADAVEAATDGQDVAINSNGILYMTASSSSGSKYYDLVPRQQTYIANRWQEDVPTYSLIDVTETTLTINTYRTDTDEAIDSQFTIVKSVSHENLSSFIEEATALAKDAYTEDSWHVFEQALQGAITVNANPAATSDELGNAYAALNNAMNALVKKSDSKPEQKPDNSDNQGQTQQPNSSGSQTSDSQNKPTTNPPTSSKPSVSGQNAKPQGTVQTGDTTSSFGFLLTSATAAIAAIASSVRSYRKRKIDE